jgi:hypothetical protein
MTDNYDTETLKAIIQEAKRQGFDDKRIALNLGIARDNSAFGYVGEDQMKATISEFHRRGIHLEGIADRMDLPLEEVLRLHGDADLRIGLHGGVWVARPGASHHESNILKLIALGRKRLAADEAGGVIWHNPNRNETLALLVDALGLEGTRNLIASVMCRAGNDEPTAAALHIPEAAAMAVGVGSFPTSETAPTLQ